MTRKILSALTAGVFFACQVSGGTLALNRVQIRGEVTNVILVTVPSGSERIGVFLDDGAAPDVFVECRNAPPYLSASSGYVYACEVVQVGDCVELKGHARADGNMTAGLSADFFWLTAPALCS